MGEQMTRSHQRDQSIDCIKFIGLLGLVASHIYTNDFVLQVRSFDVNLLVILSAYLANKSFASQPIVNLSGYAFYIKKRFSRLIFPTWVFISIYVILNYLIGFQEITLKQVIRSYLLLNNSIGYVWIIYVYLICAIMNPIIAKLDLSQKLYRCLLVVFIMLYIVLLQMIHNYYLQLLILYPIIYGLISAVGFFLDKLKIREWGLISAALMLIWSLLAIYYFKLAGQFVLTGEFKYPPRLYYLTQTSHSKNGIVL